MRDPRRGSLYVTRLQTLMKSITLRRTKHQKVDGKPILSLPPRTEEIRLVELNEVERGLYNRIHEKAMKRYESFAQENQIVS